MFSQASMLLSRNETFANYVTMVRAVLERSFVVLWTRERQNSRISLGSKSKKGNKHSRCSLNRLGFILLYDFLSFSLFLSISFPVPVLAHEIRVSSTEIRSYPVVG